ncbi:MAG: magnesium transporter CorA family protein [Clostridiaceae bacterium]
MVVFDIFKELASIEGKVDLSRGCYWVILEEKELKDNLDLLNIENEEIMQCLDFFQPSKINFFDGYIFIAANLLEHKNNVVTAMDFNIFFNKENVFTVVRKYNDIVVNFIKEVSKSPHVIKEKPYSDVLVYYVLDRIIVKDYEVISQLEIKTDEIEISILKGPNRSHIEELIRLRREVYRIRKFINPLRYIGDSLLGNDNEVIEKDNIKYFNNLNNKINKLLQTLDNLVQDLSQVREAFEAETANKTNELIKVFTLITGILLPINIITSIFGMEIMIMPLRDNTNAFKYICCAMVVSTILLLIVFKKKKWF